MIRFAESRPEIFWPVLVWAFALIYAWSRFPLVGAPYGLGTLAYVLVTLLAIFAPAYLFGKPSEPEVPTKGELVHSWALALLSFALISSFGFYVYSRPELVSLEVHEARSMRAVSEVSKYPYLLFQALSSLGAVSAVIVAHPAVSVRSKAAYAALIGSMFVTGFFFTGARYQILPHLMFFGSALLLFYSRRIWKNLGISIIGIGGLLLVALLLNTMLSIKGSGENDATAGASVDYSTRGLIILDAVGVASAPSAVYVALGAVDEYVASPLYYLDHYLMYADIPAAKGGLQVSSIASMFGVPIATDKKDEVDALYEELDIHWNVWATGIREMNIDAGKYCSILVFSLIGTLLGFAKRRFAVSLSARYLSCVILAYLVFLPFSSLFKAGMMEAVFSFAVAWFLMDWIRDSFRV